MKTKDKEIAMVEIAIVLCSLFLVALPAIATEQTTQEVTASEVTIASEDDFTLDIYGNANEDDTIDMRDTTYIKLVIFNKKPETKLADANNDGKVSMLDVGQTKLIILDKEKELTLVDSSDTAVTVKKPVERIICMTTNGFEALRTVDGADKLVGVDGYLKRAPKIYTGEAGDLPSIGGGYSPDYEAILDLKPDLVMGSSSLADKLKSIDPSIVVLSLHYTNVMTTGTLDDEIEDIMTLGYILDREDEAKEFIDWRCEIIDSIKAKTDELSDDEKPRVIYGDLKTGGAAEWYTYNKKSARHETIEIAGGRNIAKDVDFGVGWGGGACGYVDFEWLIGQNPDLIVRYYLPYRDGRMGIWYTYGIDDKTEIIAKRDEVLNHPELATLDAVKNKNVQIISCDVIFYGTHALSIAYFAKTFHPELFKDLDPKAIHQEFLTRFQHIDYDLDEHGAFVYPPTIGGLRIWHQQRTREQGMG